MAASYRSPGADRSDAIFVQVFENAPIGMALVDNDGAILRANCVFAAMLGRSADALAGVTFGSITHPDDLEADLTLFGEVLAGTRNGYQMGKRYLHRSGSVVDAKLSVTAARSADGGIEMFVAQIEDDTEQRATERRLREDAARLSLAVEALQGGFWHMDVATARFETSPKLSGFVETHRSAPLDLEAYCGRIDPEDLPAADLAPLMTGQVEHCSAEYRVHTSDGPRWVRCDRRLVRDQDGRPERIVGVVIDIDDERRRRLASQQEADTDPLTGLLNRRGLLRCLAAVGDTDSCGVLAVDLDRFKQVNDRYGHAAGDAVLAECARRLREETRQGDLVARMGGDEFVVVMRRISARQLTQTAGRLSRALAKPFAWETGALSMAGSVGAAWAGDRSTPPGDLLKAADRALYQVKNDRPGEWRMAS